MRRIIQPNILLICMILFCSCKPFKNPEQISDSVIIQTVPVQAVELKIPIHTAGRISSKEEMKLSFKVGGLIEKILVEEGEKVSKGTVLARINMSEIEAQVNQCRLALEKAKRDFDRANNLFKDSVATLEQFQNAKTMVELSENNLRVAEFNRKYSSIVAPCEGTILKKLVSESEIIASGYPVFLFGSNEKGWVFKGTLTDLEITQLSLSDTAQLKMDAFPNKLFRLKISRLSSFADPYTGTYEVEMNLPQEHYNFSTGMLGRVDIFPKYKRKYTAIPVEAIIEAFEDYAYVYFIKDSLPVKTKIKQCLLVGNWIYSNDSIPEGVKVVVKGTSYITSGKKLKIVHQKP
jgi:multidrug efflux system membrane fusion protein